jgi:hypothetical protein
LQLKLTEVDTIDLLDKRGYLTVCINLLKDGKIYLRRPEGIREWCSALQVIAISLHICAQWADLDQFVAFKNHDTFRAKSENKMTFSKKYFTLQCLRGRYENF